MVELLNVSRGRITTTWVNLGLKLKKKRLTDNASYYYVIWEDLIKFLKDNQNEWDSRNIEMYMLGPESGWLAEKRKRDALENPLWYRKWSDEEIQDFCDKNVKEIIDTAKFMTGFELVIKKLKERYDFVVITARTDYQALVAKKAFENIGLGDIRIFNNEHSKIEKFLEEKVDYIIDDDDIICSNAADNGVCALYFKNNAATRMEKDNVININNFFL